MSQICNEVNSFTKYAALEVPVNYNLREFERDTAIFVVAPKKYQMQKIKK